MFAQLLVSKELNGEPLYMKKPGNLWIAHNGDWSITVAVEVWEGVESILKHFEKFSELCGIVLPMLHKKTQNSNAFIKQRFISHSCKVWWRLAGQSLSEQPGHLEHIAPKAAVVGLKSSKIVQEVGFLFVCLFVC